MVSRNGGFVTKLQAFESPDSDKRARNKTDLKIGSEIESEKNNGLNPIKRKTTNGLNEQTFINRGDQVITFVKTNGPANGPKATKSEKKTNPI